MVLFYVDYGVVVSQGLQWLQGALNMPIGLSFQYKLVYNFSMSKAITFHPGTLRYFMSEEVVVQECTVRGATYRERLRRRIPGLYCGV